MIKNAKKNRNEIGSLKQKLQDDIYPKLDMSKTVYDTKKNIYWNIIMFSIKIINNTISNQYS